MIQFILRRLAYGVLVLWGVITVVFLLFHVLPGDPARLTMGQRADVATLETIRKELGLDQPLHIQYIRYFNDVLPLSIYTHTPENQKKYGYTVLWTWGRKALVWKTPYLRYSYQTHRPVTEILTDAFPATFVLAVAAMLFATVLGILFGIISAVRKFTWVDHSLVVLAVVGISVPSFFSGIVIAWLFGYKLAPWTGLNMFGSLYEYDPYHGPVLMLKNLILPALTLGIRPLALITQLMRGSLMEVLTQDFVRTAYAKGLSGRVVILKHALRNALNPVVTTVSEWFAALLAGAFFVEYIFDWKGLGKVTVDALNTSDFPVVMGSVLFISTVFILTNIAVDIIYGWLDPRVRIG